LENSVLWRPAAEKKKQIDHRGTEIRKKKRQQQKKKSKKQPFLFLSFDLCASVPL